MPRIVGAQDTGNGFRAWWDSLPPVTRNLGAAMLLTTVTCGMGLLSPRWLILYWPWVIKKFEVWRLLTTFFFMGKLGFAFLIRMIWLMQYGSPLERITYQFDPAGYVYMLLVNGLLLLAASPIIGFMLGNPLIQAVIYVWSKEFPTERVSIYGLFQIQAFFLPFAFAAMGIVLGEDVSPYIAGIVVGHVYYFLHTVYPRQSGKDLLATPAWLRNWCADYGLAGAAPPAAPGQQPAVAAPGFQAFRGRGQRLGGTHED